MQDENNNTLDENNNVVAPVGEESNMGAEMPAEGSEMTETEEKKEGEEAGM